MATSPLDGAVTAPVRLFGVGSVTRFRHAGWSTSRYSGWPVGPIPLKGLADPNDNKRLIRADNPALPLIYVSLDCSVADMIGIAVVGSDTTQTILNSVA